MGNEVFINGPERIHRRDLVGPLAQSLMAKSYRIGGGVDLQERRTRAPSLLPRPRSGPRCVTKASSCPRTAGGSQAARAPWAKHLQPRAGFVPDPDTPSPDNFHLCRSLKL